MTDLNITDEARGTRLALTPEELMILQSLLDSGDRGGFYAVYNGFSDGDQSSVQGRVSTFSGTIGASGFTACQ